MGPLLIEVYQVNKMVNELLLAEDKFMTEMNLRQPGFTCSTCGHLQETNKEYKNLKKQVIHEIFMKTN